MHIVQMHVYVHALKYAQKLWMNSQGWSFTEDSQTHAQTAKHTEV